MTGPTDHRPPQWASRLLASSLPAGTRGQSVKADLDDEFLVMVERAGIARARRWYGWEAMKLSAHFAWEGVRLVADAGDTSGGGLGMERIAQNMRIAFRRFRRSPGFTTVAVLTMALGIGANVAIFTVVNTVLLQPLPYADADELVVLWEVKRSRDDDNNVVNPGNFSAWRDRSESFSGMSAISLAQPATFTAQGEPEEIVGQYAHPDFFAVLGMEAKVGRTFIVDPEGQDATELVLSHDYWQRRFAGDPGVIGNSVEVNGEAAVIVGVMPAEYVVLSEGTDIWTGTALDRGDQTNSGRWLMVLGRLAEGRGFEVARSETEAIMAGLQDEFPDFNGGWEVNLVPLKQEVVGDVQRLLWVLLGSVALLLLIACANVANLFLVRANERRREMAVRTSLGASGRTLAGQLLTESLLVAALGAVVGVLLAHFGTRALATGMPDAFAMPRVEAAGLDMTVLLFAIGVTALTGVLFGLIPAMQAAGTSPSVTLNAEGRGPSRRSGVVRNSLVVAEVAVSLVLLAGAALFGRSLVTLMAVDSGIEPEQVLVGRVNLTGDKYGSPGPKVAFYEELVTNLEARPGVVAAGGITFLPMAGWGAGTTTWPADRPEPEADDQRAADIRNVVGDYFGAMGIEVLEGRVFDERDREDAPQTVVVNRALAEIYWPGERAVGKQIVVNWVDLEPWEVVGVVADVRVASLDEEPRETVYMNYAKATFFPWMHIAVRASGDPVGLTSVMRGELQAMDAALPLGSVQMMQDIVDTSAARPRMTTYLMLVFAALATLLAGVGLYGVLAYAVSQRVREIGVRVALGAEPGDVIRMVVRQGSGLAVTGLVIGLVIALVGGRVVGSLLFEIQPTDPWALGGAGAFLLVIALAATIIPAWRAAGVAPSEALRSD